MLARSNVIVNLLFHLLKAIFSRRPRSSRWQATRTELAPVADLLSLSRTSARRKLQLAVVGENAVNDDCVSRQRLIEALDPGEPLRLEREPGNPHDPNAIAVCSARGKIGYVARDRAEFIAPLIDAGMALIVDVAQIRGGTPAKPSRGVWINIWKAPKRRR